MPKKISESRPCARCGQPVSPQADSFQTAPGGGVQHVTCPPSPELATLEPAPAGARLVQVPPAAPLPEFLTMDEAAKLLRVTKDTIRSRIRAGTLPAKRLIGGQTVLIERGDVLALLVDANDL